ncbi:MAG TPA: Holliday junction resolvase RuvX, partial [Candidatus Sulfotelmatobacter sp.]|nr:Holliday junction resolvase RuvX [Candidatus Sulfotelmatobacter sp.]
RRTGLEVEMWDERLTTVQAERALLGERRRSGARAGRVDDAAATLMLQNWLDARQRRPSRS